MTTVELTVEALGKKLAALTQEVDTLNDRVRLTESTIAHWIAAGAALAKAHKGEQ